MQPENKTQIPEGYMADAKGRLVPEAMVKPLDKLRDQTVMDCVQKARQMAADLAALKSRLLDEVYSFVALSAQEYGVEWGGTKGNVSLVSFDGQYKVILAVSETLAFDERLQVAKGLIDECIHEWAESSRDEIKALINDAFAVDKQGQINTGRVLSLRRLDIQHSKWLQAMQAISDSVSVSGSKTYLRVYAKDPDGKFRQINLDIATL